MIFVIDSDENVAKCVAKAIGDDVEVMQDVYTAINLISDGELPEMIFLDIMPDGPDGFTLLNELISYDDTAKIPVVIMSQLAILKEELGVYSVVGILNKDEMTPQDIRKYVDEYTKRA